MTDFVDALAFQQQGRLEEAASLYEAILAHDEGHYEARYHLCLVLSALGKFDRALQLARQGVAHRPDCARAQAQVGSILLATERASEARGFLQKALALDPGRPEVLNNLGVALRAAGSLEEALEHFTRAVDLVPGYADARYNLAGLLTKCGRYEQAILEYQALVQLRPGSAVFYSALGQALLKADRIDEAITAFREANSLDPAFADAYGHLANAQTVCGRFDDAAAALEHAIHLAPRRGEFYRFLAETRPSAVTAQHLAALESMAQTDSELGDDAMIDVNFALGRIYADAGDRARSFRHIVAANARKRRFIEYDEPDVLHSFGRIAAVFTRTFLESRRGCSDSSPAPIFIFGMPRSGTTLIEHVLASHGAVFGAGELPLLEKIVTDVLAPGELISPARMRDAPCDRLREIGQRYVAALMERAPASARRVTDKMPGNFRYAGLIHLILPNARMIHAQRDPLDTCLSCFTHYFAGDIPWAYDLGELGRYYRGYQTLMEHWQAVLPPAAILNVQYECVVDDFEAQARRIVAYCGLEWDDACLEFYKTERKVKTASATQVRRPIYRTSLHQSREYGDLLEPLMRTLGDDRGS